MKRKKKIKGNTLWKKGLWIVVMAATAFYGNLAFANGSGSVGGGQKIAEVSDSRIKAVSPLQVLYYHQKDDNGTTPAKETDVIMLFETESRVLVYVQDPTDMIACNGTWTYNERRIALKFQTENLTADADFDLDLNQAEVTMPFRVFSDGKGWSRWRRRMVRVEWAVKIVFRGAMINDTQPLKVVEAVDRVQKYAEAVIAAYRKGNAGIATPEHSPGGPFPEEDFSLWPSDWIAGIPIATAPLANGIQLKYMDGTTADVLLFGWTPPPPVPLVLRPGALVKDPRVHIHSKPSKDPQFDPPTKTALFVMPFNSTRVVSWVDGVTNKAQKTGIVPKFGGDLSEKTAKVLGDCSYKVNFLTKDSVTVELLMKRMEEMKEPGVIVFSTHAAGSGSLATGEMLVDHDDPDEARRKFEEVKERLRKWGHGKLVDMEGIGLMSLELGLVIPGGSAWFVSVRTPFWQYVQSTVPPSRQVSFKHTFFYVGACYTDQNPDLRDAVRAGAYFAWNFHVNPDLTEVVLYYLISILARPTYSAEEAYYNLVRAVNTREMIYKEDRILNGQVPAEQGNNRAPLFGNLNEYHFNGYGLEGKTLIRYAGNGWFSPKLVDVGQLWWMTFAGRWGQDAGQGAENLKDCYKKYWSSGNLGRLKSPFCNAANNGKPPKAAELAYVVYLLTGNRESGFSGIYVPRWTLNETR